MKWMRVLGFLVLIATLFSISVPAKSIPPAALSSMSKIELDELLEDIAAEYKLHHEINGEERDAVLSLVKVSAEQHYADQGIKVSWAWIRYDYGKNGDLYTLVTHLDYKDAEGRGQKRQVHAELFPDEKGLTLVFLKIGDQEILNRREHLPTDLLMEGSQRVINQRTGISLSGMTKEELEELKKFVKNEIEENHTPERSIQGKVHDLVKARVEAHYKDQGISISWPWFDYTYTSDWGCYTETTRISYRDASNKKQDRSIYAEAYPENDVYELYYLKIGDELVLDHRGKLKSPVCLQFLQSKAYLLARELEKDGQDERALEAWKGLGEFANSSARYTELLEKVNHRKYDASNQLMASKKYEDAVLAYEELGTYLDSGEKLQAARKAMMERDYKAAAQLMKKGNFEGAILAFEALGGYADSAEQIAACKLAIQNLSYQAAAKLLKEGQFEEALPAFLALGDFSDSAEQALASEKAIKDRVYATALEYIRDFQYEQALLELKQLNGYLDTQDKIAFCETALDRIDRRLELSEDEISIYVKQYHSVKLVITPIKPEAPKKTTFAYASSDEQVAKVGKNGVVTGVKAGVAYITITARDNPYVGIRFLVRVLTPVSKLTLNTQKLELQLSSVNRSLGTGNLNVVVTPENVDSPVIEWSSSNEKVAVVDREGIVKAIGKGQTRITAVSRNTPGAPIKVSCTVNVTQAVEAISILNADEPVYVGKVTPLKTEVLPKEAANRKLIWTSSNPAIATVSSDGKVKGVTSGSVVITALSASGVSVKMQIQVEVPPTVLRVTGGAKLIDRNHVGSRWTKEFRVDDIDFTSSAKINVKLGQIVKVFCWITENDKNPETGMLSESIEITEKIMKNGLTIHHTVYVTENNGRYSGHSAEWEVTIRIGP